MRRLVTLAAFLLIISLVPVYAQRGGGHGASGGGHAGFSGGHGGLSGHSGFTGGGHVSGFSGSRVSSFSASRSGSRFGSGSRFNSRNRSRTSTYRCYGCYGYGYGYPYYGYPYYGYYAGIDPYWWWDTYPNDDDSDQRAMANDMNQQNLQEQQMLRQQDQDAYARPMNRPPRDTQARDEHAQNEPPTLLVFRNAKQREIQNYAIVDEMLWIFTPQRIEKVPLAVLDIPATIKANDDRGVDFRLPRSSEGQ